MSRWSLWGAERGWADVGFWVAVCFLAKISSHRPTCKTTFARLTQSQAISQSFRVFISFRSRRDTTFFIFRNSFLYKITVSFTMVIKRPPASPGGQACRWRAVNFEIHLWSSGKNADCIFGDRSASSMSKWKPAWTLTRKWFLLGQNPWRKACWSIYSCHVDRRRWRSQKLTSDLKRCLLFRKCLRWLSWKAVSVPTSVIGGLVAP